VLELNRTLIVIYALRVCSSSSTIQSLVMFCLTTFQPAIRRHLGDEAAWKCGYSMLQTVNGLREESPM
jgi:hypothetical protein